MWKDRFPDTRWRWLTLSGAIEDRHCHALEGDPWRQHALLPKYARPADWHQVTKHEFLRKEVTWFTGHCHYLYNKRRNSWVRSNRLWRSSTTQRPNQQSVFFLSGEEKPFYLFTEWTIIIVFRKSISRMGASHTIDPRVIWIYLQSGLLEDVCLKYAHHWQN